MSLDLLSRSLCTTSNILLYVRAQEAFSCPYSRSPSYVSRVQEPLYLWIIRYPYMCGHRSLLIPCPRDWSYTRACRSPFSCIGINILLYMRGTGAFLSTCPRSPSHMSRVQEPFSFPCIISHQISLYVRGQEASYSIVHGIVPWSLYGMDHQISLYVRGQEASLMRVQDMGNGSG